MDLGKLDVKRILAIIGIVGVILALTLNKGFINLISRRVQEYKLKGQLKEIIAENERLKQKINWLQHDDRYIEYRIRRDLGYIKRGEKEYRITDDKKQK